MSKNIPVSTSVSVSSLEHVGRKKPKRKVSKVRLPTPPPDPTLRENDDEQCCKHDRPVAEKEAEFLEYLESLQKSPHQNLMRTNSTFAPAIATEDAFDHLEKLYKLMEQMLVLREQNAKLHRRVRDLEHLKNIQTMQKQLEQIDTADIPEMDKDAIFAESLLDTILMGTKRESKLKSAPYSRFRRSIIRRHPRNRSNSVSLEKPPIDMEVLQNSYRRASALSSDQDKPSKVSKWTKVKAAFKWEKACQTISEVKSQDSGVSGMQPVNCEVARYLRVPSTSEDPSCSPADSGAAGISTPGTISSTSSNEDVFCQGRREIREDTSDDEQSFTLDYIPHSKDETNALHKTSSKSYRTPWAKMKDIIQTRNSIKKKNRLSARSDDYKVDESIASDNEDVFESKSPIFLSPCNSLRSEQCKSISLEEKYQIPLHIISRYQQVIADDNIYKGITDESKWTRVKKAFLSSPSISRLDNSSPSSPISEGHYHIEDASRTDISKLQEEIQRNYRELQNKLSLEFNDKIQEWEKLKHSASSNILTSAAGTGGGTTLTQDEIKEQAFKKKMDEWEKIKGQPRHNMQLQSEEHLPPEFRKKLQEWQKLKKTTKDDSASSANSPRKKLGDWPKWKSVSGNKPENPPLECPPLSEDFLKKLESWKQIKSNNSTEDNEFRDAGKGNKTPSPKISRKDGQTRNSKKLKEQTEKELQWFEKELNKIEREKQRLERERQKFLEREERLTKLKRSVASGNKKDILVHTPSGFYRFEGISRKFTQKLYEWEKAQGIGPEASTFALLSSCYVPNIPSINRPYDPPTRLIKSKSADSIVNSDLSLAHPLLSQQPSSLSLNDMENLENECLLNTRISSVPDIIRSRENIDIDEPEAVIVEVEDIVEETAGPLEHYMEKKHVPIYQQQEKLNMCEGEARAAPNVQRSESARAQSNYNLIEEIIDLLKFLTENENEIGQMEASQIDQAVNENESHGISIYLKNLYTTEEEASSKLIEKLIRLQEANAKVTANIASEESHYTTYRLSDMLDTVQDLSTDLFQMAEKIHSEMLNRSTNETNSFISRHKYSNIVYYLGQQNAKILELRRVLSYLCAASDSTAPGKKKKIQRNVRLLRKSSSKEKEKKLKSSSSIDKSKEVNQRQASTENKQETDSDLSAQIAQGAIKKRYRYRQKGINNRTLDESDDDDIKVQRKNKQKRFQKTSSNPDAEVDVSSKADQGDKQVNIEVDPEVIQKVVVPTKTNFVNISDTPREQAYSPMQVFVKTTRKLFTPIVTSSFAVESQKVEILASPTVTFIPSFQKYQPPDELRLKEHKGNEISCADKQQETIKNEDINKRSGDKLHEDSCDKVTKERFEETKTRTSEVKQAISHLPPLPASPTPQRKVSKEISPNIRLMLVRYNQKIQEQDSPGCRSGGSSESSSPVAWRSPVNERRVKAQTERYQQDLLKLSPLLGGRREVQKSASLGVMNSGNKQVTVHNQSENQQETLSPCTRSILKSSSTNTLTSKHQDKPTHNVTITDGQEKRGKGSLKLNIPEKICPNFIDLDTRTNKLLKAKEDFLNSPISPISAPPLLTHDNSVKYPARNRLSQISVGSESSYDSSAYEGLLMKSASAGMINIDVDAYKQIDPEIHGGGYVSLPRSCKKRKESLISNITSKFRKVKMRRNKDPNKMNTISTLCRQSLVVDINSASQETLIAGQSSSARKDSLTVPSDSRRSSSGDTSPSTSRTSSWIKRPRLFKPKQ